MLPEIMEQKTALIIIDMQNDFVLPGAPMCVAGAIAIIPNLTKILNYFRSHSLPIFHVVREYRVDGSDIEITRRERAFSMTRVTVCLAPKDVKLSIS